MKKTVSILLIVTMLLASVLAMIPASAAGPEPTPYATYNVNWKDLYESGAMTAQEDLTPKTDYEYYFNVFANENSIGFTPKNDSLGKDRSYFSKQMVDITADTYFIYTFEAKNGRSGGWAGVVLAYGDARDASDQSVGNAPFFLSGQFDNNGANAETGKSAFRFRQGRHSLDDTKPYREVIEMANQVDKIVTTEDGYGKFRVVYEGYNMTVYYDQYDTGIEKIVGRTITLPVGSKIAFGAYSQGAGINDLNLVTLRNCTLKAYTEAAQVSLYRALLPGLTQKGMAIWNNGVNTEYTEVTYSALATALNVAIEIDVGTLSSNADVISAYGELSHALSGIKKVADYTALNAEIAKAEAEAAKDPAANPEGLAAFNSAINNAKAVVAANYSLEDQNLINEAVNALKSAYFAYMSLADTLALAEAIASAKALDANAYTKASWDVYAAKITAAEALLATNPTVDKQGDVNDAANALLDRTSLVACSALLADLKEVYDLVATLEEKDFSAESWAPFAAARAEVKALLDARVGVDQNLTITSKTIALADAIEALVRRVNVLYTEDTNANGLLSDEQYSGIGEVFYFDYYKYIEAKGYTAGAVFPKSLKDDGMEGSSDYVLRFGTIAGEGTINACNGIKESHTSNTFSHNTKTTEINGTSYNHAFGFSFLNPVTVDRVAFYLPTSTRIKSIDVYGASITEKDGKKVYAKEAEKTYLGTFTVGSAAQGAKNIEVRGELTEALEVDYIIFAVKFGTRVPNAYSIYEIELFGLKEGAEDFSALKDQYARFKGANSADYTEESWNALLEVLKTTDPVNKNCFSTKVAIESAAATLKNAVDALQVKPVDKTALKTLIDECKTLVESEHTADSWAPFATALKAADDYYNDENALPSALKGITDALTKAKKALAKFGDKTPLKALIDECKALKEADWQGNATAWKMFVKGIAAAEEIYNKDGATQQEIAGIIDELTYKKDSLKATAKTDAPGTPGASEGENGASDAPETEAPADDAETAAPTDGEETDAPEEETEAKKGGCGSSIALSALAVIGVVGTALVIKKKED